MLLNIRDLGLLIVPSKYPWILCSLFRLFLNYIFKLPAEMMGRKFFRFCWRSHAKFSIHRHRPSAYATRPLLNNFCNPKFSVLKFSHVAYATITIYTIYHTHNQQKKKSKFKSSKSEPRAD